MVKQLNPSSPITTLDGQKKIEISDILTKNSLLEKTILKKKKKLVEMISKSNFFGKGF